LSNENLVSGILWLLGVATVFLLATAIAMAMARDGIVLWDEATDAVRALSTLCTMTVGAVAAVHLMSGRTKPTNKE
jgi:multisubunit Na+/H+ antiporter MnhF subunit